MCGYSSHPASTIDETHLYFWVLSQSKSSPLKLWDTAPWRTKPRSLREVKLHLWSHLWAQPSEKWVFPVLQVLDCLSSRGSATVKRTNEWSTTNNRSKVDKMHFRQQCFTIYKLLLASCIFGFFKTTNVFESYRDGQAVNVSLIKL